MLAFTHTMHDYNHTLMVNQRNVTKKKNSKNICLVARQSSSEMFSRFRSESMKYIYK